MPDRGLVVFDIDGTLTDTNVVDDECYLQAVADVLDIDVAGLDWSGAPHVTDTAIAHWMWHEHRGVPCTDEDLSRLRDRFIERLRSALAAAPSRFTAIAGGPGLLEHLEERGWGVALATGGWSRSARLKLEAAGIEAGDVALASADDGLTREEIVRCAWSRAEARYGARFVRVVSVGDGPWDVRTAASLALPFVGVGAGSRADRMRSMGASMIVGDLSDWPGFRAALRTAAVPSLPHQSTPR